MSPVELHKSWWSTWMHRCRVKQKQVLVVEVLLRTKPGLGLKSYLNLFLDEFHSGVVKMI